MVGARLAYLGGAQGFKRFRGGMKRVGTAESFKKTRESRRCGLQCLRPVCAFTDAAVGGDDVPAALGNHALARLAQGQVLRGTS